VSDTALRVVSGGRAPGGWEELWARDRWRQDELPHGDLSIIRSGALRFERFAQPWLKEAAKRWARARLLGSTSTETMRRYLLDLEKFSGWLAEHAPDVGSPAQLDRGLLEDYLLWLRTGRWSASTRRRLVCALRQFLWEQAEDGLTGLPGGAVIHAAEIPKVTDPPPRTLEKDVFEQFVDPANLALLRSEQHRTVILLLAYTGLRVSSIVTLSRDALEMGSDGHPYLRYLNVKLRREAMIPIGPELAEQIRCQQRYLDDTYGPDGTSFLLPSPPQGQRGWSRGRGGRCHIVTSKANRLVKTYVRRANICDGEGNLATSVHPHLFRHHLGTSLVNDEVPLPVIQRVLDHASIEMTARYAAVQDETVRRHVMRWHERVNVRGERIALPVDGPMGEAAWMKERIARAKQALPNGYCGLPLVQTCPHPNACLSCDDFLTDPSFREIHGSQLEQTRRLRAEAEESGRVRLVELLQRDEHALERILGGLDQLEADTSDPAGTDLDLRDIAEGGA
jgi:site-specific recombinase XerD